MREVAAGVGQVGHARLLEGWAGPAWPEGLGCALSLRGRGLSVTRATMPWSPSPPWLRGAYGRPTESGQVAAPPVALSPAIRTADTLRDLPAPHGQRHVLARLVLLEHREQVVQALDRLVVDGGAVITSPCVMLPSPARANGCRPYGLRGRTVRAHPHDGHPSGSRSARCTPSLAVAMPSEGRVMRPSLMSRGTMRLTSSTGIAKPMPALAPDGLRWRCSPRSIDRPSPAAGHRCCRGLMAASVWITPRMVRLLNGVDLAVERADDAGGRDWSSPNGLPMA